MIFNNLGNESDGDILIITMNWHGGSTVFIEKYISDNINKRKVFIMQQYNNQGVEYFIVKDIKSNLIYRIEKNSSKLSILIKTLNINYIFINHLISFDLQFVINWILNSKLSFTFFAHDYFCVCPNYNISCLAKFCNENQINPICRKGFKEVKLPLTTIENWRYVFNQFLSKADHIYTPSIYTANIIKKFYPNLNIESKPHYLNLPLSKTFNPRFIERDKLRIVFLGHIYKDKGEKYLLLANEFIRNQNLPIEFIVCGIYDDDTHMGTKEGIIFTGKYDNKQVSTILNKLETCIVATLSTVFETYCYTASEAILSGYPVLAMNIGAHSLRIKKHDCGWVLPINTPTNGLDELKNFLKFIVTPEGRKQILLKAANTSKFKNGME